MKLENQVCSLELAQKLKSLGVKQESLFQHNLLEKEDVYRITYGNPRTNTFGRKFIDTVSAFTVAELGEMLPKELTFHGYAYPFKSEKKRFDNEAWLISYINNYGGFQVETQEANTEADARAKMLCYLLENTKSMAYLT